MQASYGIKKEATEGVTGFFDLLNLKLKKFKIAQKEMIFYSFYLFEENKSIKLVPNSFLKSSLLRLRGGGKKRKKKNYTKPKKIKHVRKKTKLKILSYYSVKTNNVSKLRKESPESPGCFMAEHHDRITCGKTGVTFIRNNY